MRDVPTKLSATMFVCGMEQSNIRSILAGMKVVPTGQEQAEKEFALNMVQKLRSRFAAMKDVPTKLSATMFVCGMEESERGSIFPT